MNKLLAILNTTFFILNLMTISSGVFTGFTVFVCLTNLVFAAIFWTAIINTPKEGDNDDSTKIN